MHQYLKEKQVIFSEPKEGKSATRTISTFLRGKKKSLLKHEDRKGWDPVKGCKERGQCCRTPPSASAATSSAQRELVLPSTVLLGSVHQTSIFSSLYHTAHYEKSLGRVSYKPQWLEKEETLLISGHFFCRTEFQTRVLEEGKSRGA